MSNYLIITQMRCLLSLALLFVAVSATPQYGYNEPKCDPKTVYQTQYKTKIEKVSIRLSIISYLLIYTNICLHVI